MTLIGITGKAGSGKDTVAGMLLELIPGSVKRSFADPLKDMALAVDPIIHEFYNGTEQETERLSHIVSSYGWDMAKQHPEVRRFLQRLGTEGVRGTFGPDAWVNLLADNYFESGQPVTIVPDVRFPNEADVVDVLIAVERASASDLGGNSGHASEQGLPAHITIHNDGTLDDLRRVVDSLDADYWVDVDPIKLYRAAEQLAVSYGHLVRAMQAVPREQSS